MVELEDKAKELNVDIIAIQESKLISSDETPKIKGYSTIRKDRGYGRGGGLISFIKSDIPYVVVEPENSIEGSLLEVSSCEIRKTLTDYKYPTYTAPQDEVTYTP